MLLSTAVGSALGSKRGSCVIACDTTTGGVGTLTGAETESKSLAKVSTTGKGSMTGTGL